MVTGSSAVGGLEDEPLESHGQKDKQGRQFSEYVHTDKGCVTDVHTTCAACVRSLSRHNTVTNGRSHDKFKIVVEVQADAEYRRCKVAQ